PPIRLQDDNFLLSRFVYKKVGKRLQNIIYITYCGPYSCHPTARSETTSTSSHICRTTSLLSYQITTCCSFCLQHRVRKSSPFGRIGKYQQGISKQGNSRRRGNTLVC